MKIKIKKKKNFNTNYSVKFLNQYEKRNKKYRRIKYYLYFILFVLGVISTFFSVFVGVLFFYLFIILFFIPISINYNLSDYAQINRANKNIDTDFNKNIYNVNFRNNQKYIINKEIINKKLASISYNIDKLEKKYTMYTLMKIVLSLIAILMIGFLSSILGESIFIYLINILFLFPIIYLLYNIYRFFTKRIFFYPRRIREYTILKYSPIIKKTKIVKK